MLLPGYVHTEYYGCIWAIYAIVSIAPPADEWVGWNPDGDETTKRIAYEAPVAT